LISLEVIEREISEIEARRETTYATCERLAWLYICRDHLAPREDREVARTRTIGGTEFLDACSDVPYLSMMGVLDEHMSALSVVQPREYESVLAKLRALKKE
jgi:hypothetical protein